MGRIQFNVDWVLAPNDAAGGSRDASTARHHGDFDDDVPTVKAGLARMLGTKAVKAGSRSSIRPSISRAEDEGLHN